MRTQITGRGRLDADGPQIEPRVLARRLVQLLETSRPLPIFRGQIRIKKPEADRLVTAMRDAIAARPQQGNSLGAVLEAAEAVEDALYRAMPVPMTDDVRLPRSRLEELIARLRTAGA